MDKRLKTRGNTNIGNSITRFKYDNFEIGYQYQKLYWTGQNEHWELANYQLKKIKIALNLELQRRPNRAASTAHYLGYVIP
ncbi:MAG: hypothetical protein HRT67_05395 [Flavobacteriaceae bacterium]|nr:hypothetical protein [Flavobacteriaceae bacterium]